MDYWTDHFCEWWLYYPLNECMYVVNNHVKVMY
jgi:hypothetical protein